MIGVLVAETIALMRSARCEHVWVDAERDAELGEVQRCTRCGVVANAQGRAHLEKVQIMLIRLPPKGTVSDGA